MTAVSKNVQNNIFEICARDTHKTRINTQMILLELQLFFPDHVLTSTKNSIVNETKSC